MNLDLKNETHQSETKVEKICNQWFRAEQPLYIITRSSFISRRRWFVMASICQVWKMELTVNLCHYWLCAQSLRVDIYSKEKELTKKAFTRPLANPKPNICLRFIWRCEFPLNETSPQKHESYLNWMMELSAFRQVLEEVVVLQVTVEDK